jgi:hypothetical protein
MSTLYSSHSSRNVWRYQRGIQNPYIKAQTTQWPQDTKGVLRILWYLVAIVLSVLWCTDSEYPFGILWPLCFLSFDVRILSTLLVSCDHCVVCPLMYGFWVPLDPVVTLACPNKDKTVINRYDWAVSMF